MCCPFIELDVHDFESEHHILPLLRADTGIVYGWFHRVGVATGMLDSGRAGGMPTVYLRYAANRPPDLVSLHRHAGGTISCCRADQTYSHMHCSSCQDEQTDIALDLTAFHSSTHQRITTPSATSKSACQRDGAEYPQTQSYWLDWSRQGEVIRRLCLVLPTHFLHRQTHRQRWQGSTLMGPSW